MDDSEETFPFSAADSVHDLEVAFTKVRCDWPDGESLAPLVRWLRIKLGMTEQEEAKRAAEESR